MAHPNLRIVVVVVIIVTIVVWKARITSPILGFLFENAYCKKSIHQKIPMSSDLCPQCFSVLKVVGEDYDDGDDHIDDEASNSNV